MQRGKWLLQVNHTSWVAVVTPTDRPKSVRNRCLIKLLCGVVCVFTLPFWHFRGCRGFCHRTELDLLFVLLCTLWITHNLRYILKFCNILIPSKYCGLLMCNVANLTTKRLLQYNLLLMATLAIMNLFNGVFWFKTSKWSWPCKQNLKSETYDKSPLYIEFVVGLVL